MKSLLSLLLSLSICVCQAQFTYVYFQNNTDLDFSVASSQTGGLGSGDWGGFAGNINALIPGTEVLNFQRLFAPFGGNTYTLNTSLTAPSGDIISLDIELVRSGAGTTTFQHTASGPGFSEPWRSDGALYSRNFTMNGEDYILRYQSYFTGGYDDVMYAIYPAVDPIYSVNPADLANPDVLNVMSYNVFLRPLILFPEDDQNVRVNHIADYVHDMDAIIFQEVFDNGPRATLLANLAAEYPYQTTVVDDPSNALEDGGVLIVSRWPIEVEAQDLWGNNCWEDDCISNKGIGYARINKLGTKYHIFGTHMDAFNEPEDINARIAQLDQFTDFIDAQNIPSTEAVITGGDFNIDKLTNKMGEYDSLTTQFNAKIPTYSGRAYSWDSELDFYLYELPDAPEYLDYVFTMNDYRPTLTDTNTCIILRSNRPEMFRVFDLSDHYPIWGRFEFEVLLPIELSAFEATYNQEKQVVNLHWQTASEENSKHFDIERSSDGLVFESIGTVAASTFSSTLQKYQFTDLKPLNKESYYRLKQVDQSGDFSYSEIVAIKPLFRSYLVIQDLSPNPIQSGQNAILRIELADLTNLQYHISDVSGRRLNSYQQQLIPGLQQIEIPTNGYNPGVYILSLEAPNFNRHLKLLVKD